MISGKQLFAKLLEDWGVILAAFGLLVGAHYGFRYIDAAATTDGIAGVYVAMKVLIIGYACASLAGAISARLFGMLGRADALELCRQGWSGIATVTGYSARWLIIFYLLFSRSVGQ